MSYTLGFAPDAKSEWQALPVPLQEAVLDELERLALDPPTENEHVSDVTRDEVTVRHYAFVRVATDRARRTLVVLGVGYARRDRPAM